MWIPASGDGITGHAFDIAEMMSYVAPFGLRTFLNQPIEVAELRPRVREVIGCPGFPQLLLRMDYGHAVRPTPRRPLREVIV